MSEADFDMPVIDDGQDFGPRCMECGKCDASLVGGKAIYPHRTDLYEKPFWLCACGAYCGCHPGTENPLGYPAGHDTRRARSALHRVLDPIWKNAVSKKKKRRGQVYAYLSDSLGIPREETHSAMFDAPTCRRAMNALKKFHPDWKVSP
jgi:hypothetical protein